MSPAVEPAECDRSRQRLQNADDAAKQRRLAGAVRADHREQRAGGDLAVEMMHRRMPVIAERDVAELQLRGHAHLIASQTMAHRAALTASRRAEPRSDRHAQDRPGRGLRRMRRRRAVAMGVAVVVVVAWSWRGNGREPWEICYIITLRSHVWARRRLAVFGP